MQLATICHVNYEWRSRGKRSRDNEIWRIDTVAEMESVMDKP